MKNKNQIPLPTEKYPYVQIDWIFTERASLCDSKSGRQNYLGAASFYKKFLRATHNYNSPLKLNTCFYIEKEWDKVALLKVKQWIEATNIEGSSNYLTSYSITSHISAIRQTMEYAFDCNYIKEPVLNISFSAPTKETNSRTAFSNEEYNALFKVITPQIQFSKKLLRPYKKIGGGCDPRKVSRQGFKNEPCINQGWACWKLSVDKKTFIPTINNIRWYFENVMECQPIPATKENIKIHTSFFAAARNFQGGVKNCYRKLGVSTLIDADIIMPLVVKLIAETGLNVESVLSLKRNCFSQSHPLTGLPYIQYEKNRSGGSKVLPLDLYDNVAESEFLKLRQKQSGIIANTIQTLLDLTEPLVNRAKGDKDYLLLFESSASWRHGVVQKLNNKAINTWTQKIVSENNLQGRDGNPLIFNLSRFRPTKLTELVEEGYDIFSIMNIAGHASVLTTLAYIDKQKTTSNFHYVIRRELTIIKENAHQILKDPLPVAVDNNNRVGQFMFKGPICNCKNPYDPPQQVKSSKSYHKGDACTFFNMCLQCPNVLITEMNLPNLFLYRAEINRALNNGVKDMPRQGELYKKTLAILNEVLTPDFLFPEEVLIEASKTTVDDTASLDSFVY